MGTRIQLSPAPGRKNLGQFKGICHKRHSEVPISRDSGASIDAPILPAAVSGSTENGPFEFAVTRETQTIAPAFGRWGSLSRKS